MPRDVVVIGSGPNGLSAAIAMAQAGCEVDVFEAQDTVGGGVRSAGLARSDVVNDVGASAFPFAIGSPFFRTLPLDRHGLIWCHAPLALAHPLDDGNAVALAPDLRETAAALGADGRAYRALLRPAVRAWPDLAAGVLGSGRFLRRPLTLGRLGWDAVRSATGLARRRFATREACALWVGLAAHSGLPLTEPATSAIAIGLATLGHIHGWPVVRGGAQRLSDALAAHLRGLGGRVHTSQRVASLSDVQARTILCDVTPRQVIDLAGGPLPARFQRRLKRFRYGCGVFKVDWVIDGPIPWTAPACRRAATVHVGGTLEDVASSEAAVDVGTVSARPFLILVQPSVCDDSRASGNLHVAGAYCHVPHGSTLDCTALVEAQIERFAPGFRGRILGRHAMGPRDLEQRNENLVGGDITGGRLDLWQLIARPTIAWYRTPLRGVYICSASTPPGPGVHGLCGYRAARAALRDRRTGRA